MTCEELKQQWRFLLLSKVFSQFEILDVHVHSEKKTRVGLIFQSCVFVRKMLTIFPALPIFKYNPSHLYSPTSPMPCLVMTSTLSSAADPSISCICCTCWSTGASLSVCWASPIWFWSAHLVGSASSCCLEMIIQCHLCLYSWVSVRSLSVYCLTCSQYWTASASWQCLKWVDCYSNEGIVLYVASTVRLYTLFWNPLLFTA